MKISIIGYSGSGKSTLAKRLADYFRCPVLHLDRVQFLENWKERDRTEALELVRDFLDRNDGWIIDGNYSGFLAQRRFQESDRILILDFPRRVCFPRALARYFKNRGRVRDSIAEGCREKFDLEFARWLLFGGRTAERKAFYRNTAEKWPEKSNIFQTQKQLDQFLKTLVQGEKTV